MTMKSWKDFLEAKKDSFDPRYRPPQGKGANPYMPAGKDHGKLRVAKDSEKKEPLGELDPSGVLKPSDTTLGMPGGQGGVGITEAKKGPKSPYPGGKTDGRIRKTKDEKEDKEWGRLRAPGMEPSVSSLGKEPEKGVGTTTEDKLSSEKFLDDTKDLSTAEFVEFVLKKKDIKDDETVAEAGDPCDLDDFGDFKDDFTGKIVYVAVPKVLKRAAKAIVASDKWPKVFARELKRIDGGLPTFMNEMMNHPEVYSEIAAHINTNENKAAKKLAKAMNQPYLDYLKEVGYLDESTADAPMDKRLGDPADFEDEPQEPAQEAFPGEGMPGAMPGGPLAGAAAEMGAFTNDSGPAQPPGGAFGGGGAAGAPAGSFSPTGQSPAGVGGNPPGAMPGGVVPSESSSKEFGYHHLIKEMGGYDNMKNAMKEYLEM